MVNFLKNIWLQIFAVLGFDLVMVIMVLPLVLDAGTFGFITGAVLLVALVAGNVWFVHRVADHFGIE